MYSRCWAGGRGGGRRLGWHGGGGQHAGAGLVGVGGGRRPGQHILSPRTEVPPTPADPSPAMDLAHLPIRAPSWGSAPSFPPLMVPFWELEHGHILLKGKDKSRLSHWPLSAFIWLHSDKMPWRHPHILSPLPSLTLPLHVLCSAAGPIVFPDSHL